MKEPIAYYRGDFVPFATVTVSPGDAGFVQGAAVAEQLRTFGGRLFRLDDHLQRLAASLDIVGIELAESPDRLAQICSELIAHNHPLLEPGDDLGLGIFVTPGLYPGYGENSSPGPTVCLHTYPLPFDLWHEKYDDGQALVVPAVRQVPDACWPSALKCRSRMHYYLADRQAAQAEPGARALLVDLQGHVTEASTANIVTYQQTTGLISPLHEKVLPGISLAQVAQSAASLAVPMTERDLTPQSVAASDEVLLTSTPLCLLPVTRLNGQPIGDSKPGPMFRRLLDDWNERVQLDIAAQAHRFAQRH